MILTNSLLIVQVNLNIVIAIVHTKHMQNLKIKYLSVKSVCNSFLNCPCKYSELAKKF